MKFEAGHRPYALPERGWAMAMTWHDLLFAHWRVGFDRLRGLLPGSLELDTFEGEAWIGVVPFWMTGIRHRRFPAVPGLRGFAELNVRTYVTAGGKAGVWFFSLDAAHAIAVSVARATFHLPYYRSRMSAKRDGQAVNYASRRTHRGAAPAAFEGRYRPMSDPFQAKAGTLDYFLTERYCLYAVDGAGRLRRGEIHHAPWPLQRAEAEIAVNTMTEPLGVDLSGDGPVLHFARRLEVVAWRTAVVD